MYCVRKLKYGLECLKKKTGKAFQKITFEIDGKFPFYDNFLFFNQN